VYCCDTLSFNEDLEQHGVRNVCGYCTWRSATLLLGRMSAGAAGQYFRAAASAFRMATDAGRTAGVTTKPRPFPCKSGWD